MDEEKPNTGTADDSENPSRGNGRDDEEIHIEVIDPDHTPELAPPVPSEEILALEKQMEDLRKEKSEIYDRLLRKHADFENFRKRAERDKREFQLYALSDFVLELLPIMDNFERALSLADEHTGPEYRKGVELIYRQLRDLLEKRGLKVIDTQGQSFDPNLHEAISREERNDLPDSTILEELQTGYVFRERLLRPAMVKVSYNTAAAEGESNQEPEEPARDEAGSDTE